MLKDEITCPSCAEQFTIPSKTKSFVGNIPEELFWRINQIPFDSLVGFYICSPFLSDLKDKQMFLKRVGIEKKLVVITRHPDTVKEDWHRRQFSFLKDECYASINVINNLHAKLYILEAGNSSFAMLGSMNLTHGAGKNVELAVFTSNSAMYTQQWHHYHKDLKPMSEVIT